MLKKRILYFIIVCLFTYGCSQSSKNNSNFSIAGSWCYIDENETYREVIITDSVSIITDGISKDFFVLKKSISNYFSIEIFEKEYVIEQIKCDTLIISNDKSRYYLCKFENNAQENIAYMAFYFRKYTFLVHHGVISIDSAWINLEKIGKEFFGLN